MDRVHGARLGLGLTAAAAVWMVVRAATAPLAIAPGEAVMVDEQPTAAACEALTDWGRPEGRCGELHDGLTRACESLRTASDPQGALLDVDAAHLQLRASGCLDAS